MASNTDPLPFELGKGKDSPDAKDDPKRCSMCGGQAVRGDLSSVANFGVTREPHFVTSYGWMQVKYDRATPIDVYMCLSCGHINLYGRQPMSVLDPMERQQLLRDENPALDKKLRREEKRRGELEKKGRPLESDDHTGI
jgi:hypothetical protein